ncbi:hypothetical protein U7S25_003982 [Providencia rettgeri]|nr:MULTISPECIES: hypothetical protein [Providencia]EJD6081760.1 hypothetical protein [Providencia rettgeri]EJD6508408.1 hypothetical protein [Providencia rettgeri]EJD6541312.1 hypothetical protein [Providencia rettgeri]EJD6600371.1 hypothetical protein [Providencia rettgeri]ELR5078829.1 hypothetical protein [Providencia rettgeri]
MRFIKVLLRRYGIFYRCHKKEGYFPIGVVEKFAEHAEIPAEWIALVKWIVLANK